MKKFLFFICALIMLPTYAQEAVQSGKKKPRPASHELTQLLKKKTKAQLYKEIAQLKRERNRADKHYQEEVRDVREQLEQAQQENADMTLSIAQKQLSTLALKNEILKLHKQLAAQVEAHSKATIAQHALLEVQDGKLKNKRAQIAQLQARVKALEKQVKELTDKKQLERSPSLLAMYA